MEKTTKRIAVLIMLAIFLLAACAPASVRSGGSTQAQFIQDAAVGTVSAFNEQATQTQASFPTLTASPSTVPTKSKPSAFETISGSLATVAAPGFLNMDGTIDPTTATATSTSGPSTGTSNPEATAFHIYCEPGLKTQVALEQIESIKMLVTQLGKEQKAIVRAPVNLRTQPNFGGRILLVLKPNTEVEVVDGPRKLRLGNGARYVWWKVKLNDGTLGWAAEMSACRQFYFIAPPDTATPTP